MRAAFARDGYVALRGLLPQPFFAALAARTRAVLSGADARVRVEVDAPQRRVTAWNEDLSLLVGLRLRAHVEALVGRPLALVYTFAIRYDARGVLHPHVDREQNAFSLSLSIGAAAAGEGGATAPLPPWPLHVAPRGLAVGETARARATPMLLEPNDAVLYEGPRHVHFRDEMPPALRASLHVIFGFRDINASHCDSQ